MSALLAETRDSTCVCMTTEAARGAVTPGARKPTCSAAAWLARPSTVATTKRDISSTFAEFVTASFGG
eukprot:scaffold91961_cov63-Phaeocystis_antarctica.AAC.1